MGRSRKVTEDDLQNDYLSNMVGEDDASTEETEGVEGGEENQEGGEGDASGEDAGTGGGANRQQQQTGGNQQQQNQIANKKQQAQIDPATGKPVVAKKQQQQNNQNNGLPPKQNLADPAVRQVYDQLRARIQPVINKIERERNEALQKLEVHEARVSFAKQHNLNEKEQLEAFQLAAALKSKPAETIQYLLTKAHASGINISLGNGQNVGMSPEAIKAMINETIAPLTRQAQQQEQFNADRDQARQQIETFFATFPDAQFQADALNHLLQKHPTLTLEQGYIKLREFFMNNQLDWNVPLSKHVEALRAGQQQQQNNQPNARQSMPNGRGFRNQVAAQQQQEEEAGAPIVADVHTPRRDIIRQAMASAGYDVRRLNS